MPIIHTYEFWDYIVDEPQTVLYQIKEGLTFKEFDFDTRSYKLHKFYQRIGKYLDDEIIRFPAGLSKYIREKLGLQIEYKEKPFKEYTRQEVLNIVNEIPKLNPKFEIRDYQIDAVLASLNNFSSLISATVGSGKTSIMSMVCKILSDDFILIMNGNNFILQQIYDRLTSIGITDISWNPSKDPDYSKKIVLINTKLSDSKLNSQDQDYIEFLSKINTLIWDEAHHVQALTSFEPLFYTNPDNLHHIIGYSGSPFRNPDRVYKNLEDFITVAILGEPAFTYNMADTIADGNIAQPYSYFINFANKPGWVPAGMEDNYFMQYRSNIVYNKSRNKAGMAMLRFLNQNNIKTLASFNNIKPGQNMLKELKENGVDGLFICGDNTIYEWKPNKKGKLKLETRSGTTEDVKEALHEGYNIIVGSSVLDEGVDLSEFQAVVLFSAGKTCISNIQRIGRASRKRVHGQNVSLVIDFKDINGYYIFQDHYEKRKAMMKKCGVINIENVQEFMKLVEELGKDNAKN